MEHLNSVDIDDWRSLEELYESYSAVPESTVGVRFSIARRLLTVVLENEGMKSAKALLGKVRKSAKLESFMTKKLESWLDLLPSSSTFGTLALDGERFRAIIDREILRLQTKNEIIIRNSVSNYGIQTIVKARLRH